MIKIRLTDIVGTFSEYTQNVIIQTPNTPDFATVMQSGLSFTPGVTSTVVTLPSIVDGTHAPTTLELIAGELDAYLSIVTDSGGIKTLEYNGGYTSSILSLIASEYST